MLKRTLSISVIVVSFLVCAIFFVPHDKTYFVKEVKSPIEMTLNNGVFVFNGFETFDDRFTEHNKILASKNNMTETEAFLLGNLGKYWAESFMKNRPVYVKDGDLLFHRYSYLEKLKYSGFCFVNSKPFSADALNYRLKNLRRANYKVLDLDTDKIYFPEDKEVRVLKNYLVLRNSHLKSFRAKIKQKTTEKVFPVKYKLDKGNIKIFFADSTTKLKPDRKCESDICKEILSNINNAQKTIDMAVYGYSTVPEIENALNSAIKRGVKIRLVYDVDSKGQNIYPNTNGLVKIIPQNMSDKSSPEVGAIMHNKFYIFDDRILIAGSANLSHTDMSGFNSNSVAVINSSRVAEIYKQEFEQMYAGKFHSQKVSNPDRMINLSGINLKFYFSPQDKSITNAVLPVINSAQKYIYIPTFVLTEKRVCDALIAAKNRGVEVKVIIDALSASNKHSKHKYLRENGILVKTENYAGKMHSKSMISDDKLTIIGSMNFSYSGENKNDENLILIEDKEIAKFYKENFLYQWNRIDNKWLKLNARAEGKDSIGSCSDGIDNNYDGLTDLADPACRGG